MAHEISVSDYHLSDDPKRIDTRAVHAFLTRSYWAEGIPLATVERSLANSLCIGIYGPTGEQVGLVRVISDYTTFAYLCDVYVLEAHRGRGLSKAAMSLVMSHPKLQGLRRLQLVTQDAQGLYAQYGFKALELPERHMELRKPQPYGRPG